MSKIETRVHALFKQYGYGVKINVLDIGKVLNACREDIESGGDGVNAIKDALKKYEVEL